MKLQAIKRIARFAIFGAIGFSVGGILGLLISDALWQPGDFFYHSYLIAPPGTGLIGGAMLGAALRQRSKVIALALLGAIGFSGGVIIAFGSAILFSYPSAEALSMGIVIVMGAIGGGTIGIGLMRLRPVLGLALAGALGGLVGGAIFAPIITLQWSDIILPGIIGGALLGAALGFLEKGEKVPVIE